MSDKIAMAKDWRNVGNDMRVAFGIKKPVSPTPIDTIMATLQGIRTINVCGTRIKNR